MKQRLLLASLFVGVVVYGFAQPKINQYEYWFDTDLASKTVANIAPVTSFNLSTTLPTNNLPVGLHTLQMRFRETTGAWSSTTTQYFVKPKSTSGGAGLISQYEYWFDNDYAGKTTQSVTLQSELSLVSPITTNQLSVGLHTFQIRFMEGSGSWSSTTTQYFVKPKSTSGSAGLISQYEYWFDTDYAGKTTQSVTSQSELSLVSSIATNQLLVGLHSFQIRFKEGNGAWSSTTTQYFLKPRFNIPDMNRITAYRYWLETEFDKKVDVKVNPVNPLLLNNLLIPISASRRATPNNYELIVSKTNGNQIIYKREALFNIQFKDTVGQWSSTSIDTINYRYPVDALCDTLQMRVEKVNQLPQSDTINCYLFDANAGDSIILQTNKGLLVDLFDSEGNKIKTIERTKSFTGDTLIFNGYTPWYALVHGFDSSIGTYSIEVRKVNVAPLANAGTDQTVDEGSLVVLNGAASIDPDGQAIYYQWIAPDEISLDDPTLATPSFTAPMVHADTTFVFTLTVNDGLLESLPDTVLITVENIPIPGNLVLSNQTIGSGSVRCFNALDTIIVAGDGTVVLERGSSSTLIAGQSIRFLPGFHAQEGSAMEAYITTDGTFCDGQTASVIEQPQEKSIVEETIIRNQHKNTIGENKIKIYPNPNNGSFTVQNSFEGESKLIVISLTGQRVYGPVVFKANVQVQIDGLSKGIYLCRIQNQQGVQTRKIEVK